MSKSRFSAGDNLTKFRKAILAKEESVETVLDLLETRHYEMAMYVEKCSEIEKEMVKNQMAIMLALRLLIQNDR